jgi:hypothetical protein
LSNPLSHQENFNVTKRIIIPLLMAMLMAALAFGQDAKETKSSVKKEQTTTSTAKTKKMSKSGKGKSCDSDCCSEGAKTKSKAPKSESETETKAPESKDAK